MQKKFNSFKRNAVCAVAVSLFMAQSAFAVDPFTVRDIRVEGLQRIEPGTVFASLPFRVGETYNDDKGSSAIQALFGLGQRRRAKPKQRPHDPIRQIRQLARAPA